MIIFSDLVIRILAILQLIERDHQNTRKQSVDIVLIQEAEEEIVVQRVTEGRETVILGIEIKDVIILVQADLIHQIVPKERLDLSPGRSPEVLQAVHNQIKQRQTLRKAKL